MAIFQMMKEIKFSSSRLGKHPALSKIKDELGQGQKKKEESRRENQKVNHRTKLCAIICCVQGDRRG